MYRFIKGARKHRKNIVSLKRKKVDSCRKTGRDENRKFEIQVKYR
jgi:hypothetical protein